jgi:hypothetical protein
VLKNLRLLLLVRWVMKPLVLLQSSWWWSLLVPVWSKALIVAALTEPAIPTSITITAEATTSSLLIIPPGAKVWMRPEVGIKLRTREVYAIADLLVVAKPMRGTITMAATAPTAAAACTPSAATSSKAPFTSAPNFITYTASAWCYHGSSCNLRV